MTVARDAHVATLLSSGKVLIAGGQNTVSYGLASAELYDPVAGTFTATGSLSLARWSCTATLLPNGEALAPGGYFDTNADITASAELYNPASGEFTLTRSMTTARAFPTATLLPSGMVLIAGGTNGGADEALASAELYE